jgi:protein O-GlcNAc transferase
MTTAPGVLAAAFQHYQAGRIAQAEALCRQILAVQRNHPDALFLGGLIAQRQQRPDQAVALISQAIAQNRKNADYHNALGMAYRALGRFDEAAQSYRRALTLRPAHAYAHFNLGNLYEAQGDLAAAVKSFRRAVLHDPGFVEAQFNLATALHRRGDPEAAEIYRRAIALRPDYVEAHNNLGVVLRAQGEPAAAADSFRRALGLAPRFANAQANLGNVLLELGRTAEAIAASRQAVALDPANAAGHSDFIFNLNFDDRVGPEEHQAERRRWSERHAPALAASPSFPANDAAPARRLRIGYVSAHFRAYAASYAFGGVLLNHRSEEVEMFCYSDGRREDELTRLFRARADHWRDITGQSDDAVATFIRDDRIDILVDLVGHQVGQRLLVFARKPAPIQVTAWGEPTGTGLAAMDYIFADPVLIPPAERHLLAERVIDLPGALGYWMPDALSEPGPLPALAKGYPTFGSFNRRGKITAAVIKCWAELLRAVPAARLVLKNKLMDRPEQRTELGDAFAAAGVAQERLTLLGATTHAEHFAAYRTIDVALDPFPHSGGMTTLDAIAMGLPVVTWAGRTIISRLAASCLAALDLPQFIALDLADYIAIAAHAVGDLDALATLRGGLRDRLMHSAVGDPVRYARAVEAAYRQVWQEYSAKLAGRA